MNRVNEKDVMKVWEESELKLDVYYGKMLVVACQLPNGFVIVESSGALSEENFNLDIGLECCRNRIIDKIWAYLGYVKAEEIYKK